MKPEEKIKHIIDLISSLPMEHWIQTSAYEIKFSLGQIKIQKDVYGSVEKYTLIIEDFKITETHHTPIMEKRKPIQLLYITILAFIQKTNRENFENELDEKILFLQGFVKNVNKLKL